MEDGEYSLPVKPGVYGTLDPFILEDGDEPDTKATVLPDENWKYVFEEGDGINVWSTGGTLLVYYVVSTSDEGAHANFAGEGFTLTDGQTYYSSHPLIPSTSYRFNNLPTTFEGQVQAANNDAKHLADYTYTYSSAVCNNGNTHFQYSHLSSRFWFIIHLPEDLPEGTKFTELTIEASADNFFAVDGISDITTGSFTPGNTSKTMTLKLGEGTGGIAVSDNTLIAFLAVAPCAAGEFIIRVTDGSTVYTSPKISKTATAPSRIKKFEVDVYPGDVPAVAKIGDVLYYSLAEAVAAVPKDGAEHTITMIGNETILGNAGVTVEAGKNVILDLNGKTITGVFNQPITAQAIANKGTLAITDSSDGQAGKITIEVSDENAGSPTWNGTTYDKNWASNVIRNDGVLTVDAGNIVNPGNGAACYAIDNYGAASLTVNGGTLNATRASAVRMFYMNGGSVTINDGTIGSADSYIGLQVMGTGANGINVTLNGGTFSGDEAFYAGGGKASWATSQFNISGGTFENGVGFTSTINAANIDITGGEYHEYLVSYGTEKFIEAGKFTEDAMKESFVYLAEGYKFVQDGEFFIVVPASDPREAIIPDLNMVYYYWLEEGEKDGGFYDFYAPFAGPDPVLMDGEFIELLTNINLTKDVVFTETCSFGDPIFAGGTFCLTFGEFDINLNGFKFPLPTAVSVKTDKQTAVFSAAEEGYVVVEAEISDGDFHYQYSVSPAVAKIGDVYYSSLAAAIAAVPTDGSATTITMIGDEAVVAGVTIAANQNIVLELNGKTISGNTDATKTYALISNKGTLVIQDNTDTGKDGTGNGLITTYISNPDGGDVPGYASNTITNNGDLTIKSGKIVNNGSGYACFAIDNQTNGALYTPLLTIEGGRMQQMNANTYAVRMFCNSTSNVNSAVVSGGIIEGGYGFWLQTPNASANKASLTITGGTLNANDGAALYIGGTKAVNSEVFINITGGDINGTGAIIQGPLSGTYGSSSISGGEFVNVQCGANVEKFITGGVFETEPNTLYIADGYKAVENNGLWTVVEADIKIGNTAYETLTDALAQAQDGDVINLNVDYDATGEDFDGRRNFNVAKSVTINGNNHTLTVSGRGVAVGANASSNVNVTFKDITINNSSSGARCIDTRGHIGTLTLDGVTLSTDGAPSSYTQPLTIGGNQSSTATVNITNSTIQTNEAGSDHYAIITFNPVNMSISNSTLKGWACIQAKGVDSSAGSAGSVFNITDCDIISTNIHTGDDNRFAAFIIADDNVMINVATSTLQITSTNATQWIVSSNANYPQGGVFLGTGNTVTFIGPDTQFCNGAMLHISGGTFNADPTNYVTADHSVTEGTGIWTVE
ncbi:MAG: hypothetical protein K6F25_01295 [Bacteroidales bacterium]|nr:hypothetical protein [Bacteroidales bacterium]